MMLFEIAHKGKKVSRGNFKLEKLFWGLKVLIDNCINLYVYNINLGLKLLLKN